MSRPRVSLRRGLLFAVMSAMTTWFTVLNWSGFADNHGAYFAPCWHWVSSSPSAARPCAG